MNRKSLPAAKDISQNHLTKLNQCANVLLQKYWFWYLI